MIDFPASPTVGQQFTAAGVTWTWDGAKWTASGVGPTVMAMNDNRIINGDMRIDQRGVASGAGGTANGYTIDRWQYSGSQASKGLWQRASGSAPGYGFPYSLAFTSNSAYALLAADVFSFFQIIEADMVSDFAWGTANAQPVTLSFIAASTLNGTFGGSIRNAALTRSYPFSFSLSGGGATKISITIPGDAAGTWVMNGNAASLNLTFSLGAGTTSSGPANAWAAANYTSVPGAVSPVSTASAVFWVTGVKLEVGNVATPYNRQSLAKSLADCQRYFQAGYIYIAGYGTAGMAVSQGYFYPVTMRSNPTIAFGTPTYSNASAWTTAAITSYTVIPQITVTAAGLGWGQGVYSALAEL